VLLVGFTVRQFSINNFIILYFRIILKFYLKHYIIYTCKLNYFDALYNISFKEHLPEGGHNRWPKHVAGYAVYNMINL
jgi:hypothetical protein